MPELLWFDLTAMLYLRTSGSWVALAEALETVSQDRLTRMRQGDGSGHTRLESACRTLFTWTGGFLLIDDTVIPKPFATTMAGLARVFSSSERQPVYGVSLGRLGGRMVSCGCPWGCAAGGQVVPRRSSWRWSGSAMPVTVGAVVRRLCSLPRNIPPNGS